MTDLEERIERVEEELTKHRRCLEQCSEQSLTAHELGLDDEQENIPEDGVYLRLIAGDEDYVSVLGDAIEDIYQKDDHLVAYFEAQGVHPEGEEPWKSGSGRPGELGWHFSGVEMFVEENDE